MEVTQQLVEQTFPFGAWYIPRSDTSRAILVGPFEFDEDDSLIGTAWAHRNKAFSLDFSEAEEEETGWRVRVDNDLEVLIRPATEVNWNSLKPQLED